VTNSQLIGPIVSTADIDHPDSLAVMRRYLADVIASYYGRPATEQEIADQFVQDPNDCLKPPAGGFLVARRGTEVVGCVGVRLMGEGFVELKRMFVVPAARRTGVAAALLRAAEDAARELGGHAMRLDTRSDLVEARGLYAKHGYTEIDPYSGGPYADHFFEKALHADATKGANQHRAGI